MRLGLNRKRIYIFPKGRKSNTGIQLGIILGIFIIIYFCAIFFLRVQPVFLLKAEGYTQNLATQIINESINDIFAKESIVYQDLVTLKTDNNGVIVAVEANVSKLNILKSEITNTVQEQIKTKSNGKILIPLGSIFKNELFAGIGPKIAIKVAPIGVASVDFEDTFISAGINQVRHQIYLNVVVKVSLLSVTMQTSETVQNRILVAETVIVGSVPTYYGSNPVFKPLQEQLSKP